MGIYDRDYYQRENSPQRAGAVRKLRNTSVTNKLLLANIVVYLVCWLVCTSGQNTKTVYDALAIRNDFFQRPWEIWRLISYGFMHSPFWEANGGIWHILTNGFLLWMFGRFVEQRYGSSEFLRFYMLAIIFSGLVFVVTTLDPEVTQAVGASGGVTAIVILFCLLHPHEKLLVYGIIPVPAWVVGLLLVGMDVFRGIGNGLGSGIAWQAHLGGAGFAAAYYFLKWDFSFLGRLSLKRKPKLAVYREDDTGLLSEDESSAEKQLIDQGEEILKQVHQKGEASLNARQRKTLERYSELLQQRRGRDDGQYRF